MPPVASWTRSTILDADGRLAEQSDTVRAVAAARRETPEATLSELADRLGMHRSAVQRSLERVETLALHEDGGVGPSHPCAVPLWHDSPRCVT